MYALAVFKKYQIKRKDDKNEIISGLDEELFPNP